MSKTVAMTKRTIPPNRRASAEMANTQSLGSSDVSSLMTMFIDAPAIISSLPITCSREFHEGQVVTKSTYLQEHQTTLKS